MKIIFGLGNPGIKYKNNRHNIGFMIIDKLAADECLHFKKSIRLKGSLSKARVNGEEVILVKPATFMNNSGICAKRVIDKYGTDTRDCLVIYDEVDLPFGVMRFKERGGSAGHRGIESMIDNLKTDDVNRLRVGIGRPEDESCVSDYVLSNFLVSEKKTLSDMICRGVSASRDWIKFGSRFVMSSYNKRGEQDGKNI